MMSHVCGWRGSRGSRPRPLLGVGAILLSLAAVACGGGGSSSLGTAAPADAGKSPADKGVGAQSVATRKCNTCHTSAMSGQLTPLPYPSDTTVELYPPNLTPDMATGVGGWTDEQLAFAIRDGQDNQGLELCPQMNHFSMMSDYEVYSIIAYLRSLPPVNQKILRSVCPPLKTKAEQQAGL